MRFFKDLSLSAFTAGFVAVLVGFTSSVAIVFQAAQAFQASPEVLTSWMWALGLGMGLCTLVPSLWLRKPVMVLTSSTFAFTICFAVWMMFAVIGIPIKKQLNLNETEFGLLAAMPVLSGSLIRVPLGFWTDRFGGRIVFFVLMLCTVVPIWMMSYAFGPLGMSVSHQVYYSSYLLSILCII